MLPFPNYRFLLSLAAFFARSAHVIADFPATYTACPCSIVNVHASIVSLSRSITIDRMHKLYCAPCTIRLTWSAGSGWIRWIRLMVVWLYCYFFCPVALCGIFFVRVLIITSRVQAHMRAWSPGATPDWTRPGIVYIYFPLAIFLTKPS